jgi:hypothetical protein
MFTFLRLIASLFVGREDPDNWRKLRGPLVEMLETERLQLENLRFTLDRREPEFTARAGKKLSESVS